LNWRLKDGLVHKTGVGRSTDSAPPVCALSDLGVGEQGIVQETPWQTEHAELLESYGFFAGSAVTRVSSAPQGDPLIYRLDRRVVAVRKETAAEIMVSREKK
jgi:Fe2+ transport system protein FeoA